jgi:hypothetical protein
MLFIDFKRAFDSITRSELYEVMLGMGIPVKTIKLARMTTDNTSAKFEVRKKAISFQRWSETRRWTV